MWPTTVDMTRDECRSVLRRLELEAYSSVVSTFRAQGHLTERKVGILKDLQGMLHISADRHRSEARRVAHDEELNTVATKIYGQNTSHEWSREGRRTFPFFPRANIHTALTPAADAAAQDGAKNNSALPYPSETERVHKIPEQLSTVPVVTENEVKNSLGCLLHPERSVTEHSSHSQSLTMQLVPKGTLRKDGKRGVGTQDAPQAAKRRIVQAKVTKEPSPEKKGKRTKNFKWTSPKKSPMSDSEKSNLASRIMHSYASPAPLPLKRNDEPARVQHLPQIATSKKDITTNLTKLGQLGAAKVAPKRDDVKVFGDEPPRIPIAAAVKKVNVSSNSLAALINGSNIIKKIPVLPNPTLIKTISSVAQVAKPKVKIISQQITPAPLTPGTQVKIPAGLNLKTLQGRPDNIKIVTGPSGKMILKAINEPVKAKVAPIKNVQTVILPPKATIVPQATNSVFKLLKEPPKVFTVDPMENNVVVLDIQPEQQAGLQEESTMGGFGSQITEDTPVDILPATDDVLDARANLRTIRAPKRTKVLTDWEEELDTQTNHIRTRHKSGDDEEESSVEYTYLPDGMEEDENIEEDQVTLDSSVDMMDDAIVEEDDVDFHENGQMDVIEEDGRHVDDVNGPKISIETLITAGQILESDEIAMREQECTDIK